MLPHSVPPRRNNTRYETVPSAVAAPYTQSTDVWSTAAPVGPQYAPWLLADGRYVAALSRNPLNAAIRYIPNHAQLAFGYQLQFVQKPAFPAPGTVNATLAVPPGPSLTFETGQWIGGTPLGATSIVTTQLPIAWAVDKNIGSGSLHPHGPYLYAGDHKARRGIWLDGSNKSLDGMGVNTTVEFSFLLPPPPSGNLATQIDMNVYVLLGESWVMIQTLTHEAQIPSGSPVQAVNLIFQPAYPSYYSFELKTEATQQSTITGATEITLASVDIFGRGGTFGHLALPHIHEKAAALQQMLITGASMMVSPLAPLLYRTGRVVCKQLPRGESWQSVIAEFSDLSESNGAVTMDLNKGAYGFLKPNGADNFIPTAPFVIRNGVLVDVNSELVPAAGWMVMSAEVPLEPGASASAPYPSGATYTTFAWQIEFNTIDTWFTLALPPASMVDQEALVLAMIRDCPQFHENPFHFSDITRWIGHAATALWKNSPSILSAIGTAIPEAAPFTNSAAGLVRLLQG